MRSVKIDVTVHLMSAVRSLLYGGNAMKDGGVRGTQRGNSFVGLVVGWIRILGHFWKIPWETRGKPELLVQNSAWFWG